MVFATQGSNPRVLFRLILTSFSSAFAPIILSPSLYALAHTYFSLREAKDQDRTARPVDRFFSYQSFGAVSPVLAQSPQTASSLNRQRTR